MNIKTIYPSSEGDVVEIITLNQAIEIEIAIAASHGYVHDTTDDVINNILCCPCTEYTDEPVGKTVTKNNNYYDDSSILGE